VSTGSNDKPLILLVDDSRVMRIALKKILQPEFDVIEASNGEAGWEALQEHPAVRCVFTDLAMPELDGFGLLGRIRAAGEARISGVPVIIITGNEDDPSMRSRAVEQGANDVVMKPFQTADILATTKKHLTAPRPAAPASAPKPAAPRPAAPAPAAAAGGGVDEAVVTKLKGDLQTALTRLREAETRLKEADGLRQQLGEFKTRQDELQRQLADEQARRSQAEAALQKAQSDSDVEAEILEFQKQVDAALGRARQAEESRKAVESELARVRQEMMFRQQGGDRLKQDEELGRVQRELEAAKKRADAAERVQSDYQDEIARLKAQLSEAASGGDALQDEIVARQQAEARASRLEEELAEASRRAREAEAELGRVGSDAETSRSETEELLRLEEEAHRQAEEQVQRLRRELELARKKAGEVEGAQRAAEQRKGQLEHKVNQLEAELRILRKEGDTGKQVAEQVESLRAEIDGLIVRADAAELAQQEAENELAKMAVELEAAEQAKRNAEHSVMRMTAQVNSMRKQVSQAEAQRDAAEQQAREAAASKEPARPAKEAPARPAAKATEKKPAEKKTVDLRRDELVEVNKPRTAAKRKLQDRFNDTIVAMWSKQQRGRRRMRLVIGLLVVGAVAAAAWYKGWWPFENEAGPEAVQESPAAEAAPPAEAQVAAARPTPPQPAAAPAAPPKPVESPAPVTSKPDVSSADYQTARAAREREVRERARQEFERLLAMSAPAAASPADTAAGEAGSGETGTTAPEGDVAPPSPEPAGDLEG